MDEFFKVLLLWQLCPAADWCFFVRAEFFKIKQNLFINTKLN